MTSITNPNQWVECQWVRVGRTSDCVQPSVAPISVNHTGKYGGYLVPAEGRRVLILALNCHSEEAPPLYSNLWIFQGWAAAPVICFLKFRN